MPGQPPEIGPVPDDDAVGEVRHVEGDAPPEWWRVAEVAAVQGGGTKSRSWRYCCRGAEVAGDVLLMVSRTRGGWAGVGWCGFPSPLVVVSGGRARSTAIAFEQPRGRVGGQPQARAHGTSMHCCRCWSEPSPESGHRVHPAKRAAAVSAPSCASGSVVKPAKLGVALPAAGDEQRECSTQAGDHGQHNPVGVLAGRAFVQRADLPGPVPAEQPGEQRPHTTPATTSPLESARPRVAA